MIDLELELLGQNSEWRLLLEAYQAQQKTVHSDAESEEETDWLSRIEMVEGVADEHLPRIHGKLIALGLLNFQLAGRQEGVVYQVSHQGKQVLNRLIATAASDEPTELEQPVVLEQSDLAESA